MKKNIFVFFLGMVPVTGFTTVGFAMMLIRIAGGVYEIVTFPLPIPKNYAPILDPAMPFADWNSRRP